MLAIQVQWIVALAVLSLPWPSAAWFEGCTHDVPLGPNGQIYINSPRYPNKYPSGSSCRYIVEAPLDYELYVQCNISFDANGAQCGTEYFYVSTEGMFDLQASEFFCGNGFIQRKSLFNKLTLAYTSSSSYYGGRFSCYVRAAAQRCDCGWSVTSKIVGGVEARPNEYPFMVAFVYLPTLQVFCGGSIISHRYILTAAHCLRLHKDPVQVGALVGDHDLKTGSETIYSKFHGIDAFIVHEGYDSVTDTNDIGLVRTLEPMEWTRGVGPICLPYYFSQSTFDGQYVDVIGWGTSEFAGPVSTVLMKATVQVISNYQCARSFPHLINEQICTLTPSKDSCQFDSGGPCIYRHARMYAVGLISYGIACDSGNPSVNTRVASYLPWIEEKTQELFCLP